MEWRIGKNIDGLEDKKQSDNDNESDNDNQNQGL